MISKCKGLHSEYLFYYVSFVYECIKLHIFLHSEIVKLARHDLRAVYRKVKFILWTNLAIRVCLSDSLWGDIKGLRSLAVPLYNRKGKVISAINCSVHAGRVSDKEMLTEFLPLLCELPKEFHKILTFIKCKIC